MGQLFNCNCQDPHASKMFTCSCLNNNSINGNQPPSVKENQPQIKVPNQNDENQNNYDTAVHPPEENSKPMPVVINETQPALQLSKPPIFTSKNSDVKEEDNNFHILKSNFIENS